jgi:hypothetical protein
VCYTRCRLLSISGVLRKSTTDQDNTNEYIKESQQKKHVKTAVVRTLLFRIYSFIISSFLFQEEIYTKNSEQFRIIDAKLQRFHRLQPSTTLIIDICLQYRSSSTSVFNNAHHRPLPSTSANTTSASQQVVRHSKQ